MADTPATTAAPRAASDDAVDAATTAAPRAASDDAAEPTEQPPDDAVGAATTALVARGAAWSDGDEHDDGGAAPEPDALSMAHLHPARRAFRGATLPLRVPGAALKAAVRALFAPKRPTWNVALEASVTALKSAARSYPRDIGLLRVATTVNIPGPLLPRGCLRATDRAGPVALEWIWPAARTPGLAPTWRSLDSQVDAAFLGSPGFRSLAADAPCLLFAHGGAWSLCCRGTHRDLAFRLAVAADCLVALPEYRRPPDVASAAALGDVLGAYGRCLAAGCAPERTVLGGDSAGGGLALAALCALRDGGEPPPAGGLLQSPWVDLDADLTGVDAPVDFLPRDLIDLFADATRAASGPADATHSPLKGDLRGLPPVLVQSGDCEILRAQQAAVAAKAGATHTVYRDMVHAFPIFAFCHETPAACVAEAAAFVRAAARAPRPPRVVLHAVAARGAAAAAPRAWDRRVFAGVRAGGGAWAWTEPGRARGGDAVAFGARGARATASVAAGGPVEVCVARGSAIVAAAAAVPAPLAEDAATLTLALGGGVELDLALAVVSDEAYAVPPGLSVDAAGAPLGCARKRFLER